MFSLILKLLPNKAKIYALRVKITKDENNKSTETVSESQNYTNTTERVVLVQRVNAIIVYRQHSHSVTWRGLMIFSRPTNNYYYLLKCCWKYN